MTNIILLLQTIVALLTAIQSPAIPFEIKTQALNLSVQAVELVQQSIAPPLVFGKISLPKLDKANLQLKYDNAPKAIKDKYVLENADFKLKAKDDPKDRIDVRIGGDAEFEPKLKIERWDDEVNFSVKLIDNETGNPTVSFKDNKIVWSKGNKEVNFYDLPVSVENPEGGYEFEVILQEKPATNKIEFTLQDKDVDYFYQPPLTPEEIAEGASRPVNVEGSYAIYAKTPKTNWTGGKEYKCGQLGFIYRPKITDAEGNWVWEELHIENGLLTITVPQDFLDKAVYPIISRGVNFGYESIGGSFQQIQDRISGSQFTGAAGTGDSISFYKYGMYTEPWKAAIYLHSTLGLVTNGETSVNTTGGASRWVTESFGTSPDLSVADYVLVIWADQTSPTAPTTKYNDGDGTIQGHYQSIDYSDNSGNYPATMTATHEDRKYSIYATYTPSGGGAATPPPIPQVIFIE